MFSLLIECSRKSIYVSLVVGTILSLVNQPDAIFHLAFTGETVARIVGNYVVPFCVATYSRFALMRELGMLERK